MDNLGSPVLVSDLMLFKKGLYTLHFIHCLHQLYSKIRAKSVMSEAFKKVIFACLHKLPFLY